MEFKFGFVGERGNGLRRLKPFLKEGFKNPKNFQKIIIQKPFLKVLEESPERNFAMFAESKLAPSGSEEAFKKFLFGVLPVPQQTAIYRF